MVIAREDRPGDNRLGAMSRQRRPEPTRERLAERLPPT
ncbi:hypothetical protein I553_3048 [Mycobacterium xenopi 4042]|uniref:Uncharacterized protein n=1 Tax=Mycobacterium xenopi 4042 TaxID=1299334 RepID=X8BKU5_MYCXE|nr:hypothetical protein I553_3048 [Mycobacterium xenopi 4042]